MIFSQYKKNIFIKRIFEIKKSIFLYSLSSLLDIIILLSISSIFNNLVNNFSNLLYLNLYIFCCFFLIALRTFTVIYFRKYAYKGIFQKKMIDESQIMQNFVNNRLKNIARNNNSLEIFKEKIINSCNLAAINFDIPIMSITAEVLFAIGGIVILLRLFGIKLLLLNFPILIILIFCSKIISRKLKGFGNKIIRYTELRLNSIDNIGEIAIELAALNNKKELNKYFTGINKPYNEILSKQLTTSNSLQILTESAAFIIILITIVSVVLGISDVSLANTATTLAILSRLVPSFTRTIAFITQLQFGVPSLERLSKINEY